MHAVGLMPPVLNTLARQVGHVVLFNNQGNMHERWKMCPHGNGIARSRPSPPPTHFSSIHSWHTMHSVCSAPDAPRTTCISPLYRSTLATPDTSTALSIRGNAAKASSFAASKASRKRDDVTAVPAADSAATDDSKSCG